jgi:hypothetical protein
LAGASDEWLNVHVLNIRLSSAEGKERLFWRFQMRVQKIGRLKNMEGIAAWCLDVIFLTTLSRIFLKKNVDKRSKSEYVFFANLDFRWKALESIGRTSHMACQTTVF